ILSFHFLSSDLRPDSAQCSYRLSGPSGTLQSPNYPKNYPPLADCNWTISVPENYSVRLNFQDFAVDGSEPCEFDRLIVRDGPDCISPILRSLCGSTIPRPIVSSGSRIYVEFTSSQFVQLKGFQADFMQVERSMNSSNTMGPACEDTLVADTGLLSTPNYPKPYPSHTECVWKIITQEDRRIKLEFLDFHLYSDCFLTYVDVYDGLNCSTRILRHCGLIAPKAISSSGSRLLVVFRSSGQNALRGFQAHYYTLPKSTATTGTASRNRSRRWIGDILRTASVLLLTCFF
ncbi:hypothetical protein FGIG_08235, partial [Fasciola gigantica]